MIGTPSNTESPETERPAESSAATAVHERELAVEFQKREVDRAADRLEGIGDAIAEKNQATTEAVSHLFGLTELPRRLQRHLDRNFRWYGGGLLALGVYAAYRRFRRTV